MNVIELQQIMKVFDGTGSQTVALDKVDLTVAEGEFVAIMGPSGSGKSTLMNIIGLLDVPTSGEYLLDGVSVARKKDSYLAKVRRKKIGFVFQSFNLLGRLTTKQNVELPMIYAGMRGRARSRKADNLLGQVSLKDRAHFRPNQLSGGQMQRVAIARALANNPSLILADEPTGNLDSKSSDAIMEILQGLHKDGATIVMVTHNPDLADLADRTIHLKDGRIMGAEAPAGAHSRPVRAAGHPVKARSEDEPPAVHHAPGHGQILDLRQAHLPAEEDES
jgi:ABC-type lipoprotein export system ATPase subunit